MVTVPLTVGKYSRWPLDTCLLTQDDLPVIVGRKSREHLFGYDVIPNIHALVVVIKWIVDTKCLWSVC